MAPSSGHVLISIVHESLKFSYYHIPLEKQDSNVVGMAQFTSQSHILITNLKKKGHNEKKKIVSAHARAFFLLPTLT